MPYDEDNYTTGPDGGPDSTVPRILANYYIRVRRDRHQSTRRPIAIIETCSLSNDSVRGVEVIDLTTGLPVEW
jgi:hypothetical protein